MKREPHTHSLGFSEKLCELIKVHIVAVRTTEETETGRD